MDHWVAFSRFLRRIRCRRSRQSIFRAGR
jgi:hypothetical protein